MQMEEASVRELIEEVMKRADVFVGAVSGLPGEDKPTLMMCGNPLAQVGAATILRNHLCDKYAAIDVDDVDSDDDD